MGNRGNRLRYVLWLVLAGAVMVLGALIVATAMDVKISTQTSAGILAVCGVISVALILGGSRFGGARAGDSNRPDGAESGAAGNISNWMFLADTYVEREEFESAEKLYRRAADAGHRPALDRLAEVLYELGQDEEAEGFRKRAREEGA